MVTSKALRAAPQKNLDNYVASIAYGKYESVADNQFTESDYATPGTTVTAISTSLNYSNAYISTKKFYESLGFAVTLNGIDYDKFSYTEHGWLNLIPRSYSFSGTAAWTNTVALPVDNTSINSTFSSDFVLIAPWFDYTVSVPASVDTLAAATPYNTPLTAGVVNDIKQGKNTKNWPFDAKDRGVRTKVFYDSKKGRYRLVRWTNSQYTSTSNRFNNLGTGL
jgi:hypothetical protein